MLKFILLTVKGLLILLVISSALKHKPPNSNWISVDDPEIKKIREHIIEAWVRGAPPPDDQCSERHHRAAVRIYTRVVPYTEQDRMLKDIQASIVNNDNTFFVGLDETIAALSSTKILYMMYWDGLMINSATYRNPMTGRTVTLHSLFSPSVTTNINYTDYETGGYMRLVNCYPFPRFVNTFYRQFVPRLTRLQMDPKGQIKRNLFIKMSSGLGGRFTEALKIADDGWMHDAYRQSSIRKSILMRGFVNETLSPPTPSAAAVTSSDEWDYGSGSGGSSSEDVDNSKSTDSSD